MIPNREGVYMDYRQALDYLSSLSKFGINLGLARIERLLDCMQHPERRFKAIHVTGTNGKGSTSAMLASILKESGIKTGMYSSPHLQEYTERIAVDGQEISQPEFAQAIAYTKTFVENLNQDGYEHPTEFEVLTAAAFYYFAAVGIEYAVIEVGMGGLLDSTNVIMPELAVITNVTLDHTDKCGTTVEEIAGHKAGIIKRGVPLITGATTEALQVISKVCAEKQAPLYVMEQDFSGKLLKVEDGRQSVAFHCNRQNCSIDLSLGLLGYHQVENSSIAAMTAVALTEKEGRITFETIRQGIAKTRWPARFEVFKGNPVVILDGAHNPAGAKVLRKNLDEFFFARNIVFVLGILRDKDADQIVSVLIRPQDKVITVRPVSDRALEPQELAAKITADYVEAVPSIPAGIAKAKVLAANSGIVCIAGSLYLAGTARKIICE